MVAVTVKVCMPISAYEVALIIKVRVDSLKVSQAGKVDELSYVVVYVADSRQARLLHVAGSKVNVLGP